jgi:hypothetical protein
VRSWDYVANVPEDLKLIITRESEEQGASVPPPAPAKAKSGLFGGAAKPAPGPQATAAVPVVPVANQGVQSAAPEGKKGLNLGRLFSGKKAE